MNGGSDEKMLKSLRLRGDSRAHDRLRRISSLPDALRNTDTFLFLAGGGQLRGLIIAASVRRQLLQLVIDRLAGLRNDDLGTL